jgi:dihydroxyacid dehydratase/phosphogluconate dehydratase
MISFSAPIWQAILKKPQQCEFICTQQARFTNNSRRLVSSAMLLQLTHSSYQLSALSLRQQATRSSAAALIQREINDG